MPIPEESDRRATPHLWSDISIKTDSRLPKGTIGLVSGDDMFIIDGETGEHKGLLSELGMPPYHHNCHCRAILIQESDQPQSFNTVEELREWLQKTSSDSSIDDMDAKIPE